MIACAAWSGIRSSSRPLGRCSAGRGVASFELVASSSRERGPHVSSLRATLAARLPRRVTRALRAAVRALDPIVRLREARRYRTGALRTGYPGTADELAESPVMQDSWYYSVELLPGVVTPGRYPDSPLLPRLLLRRCRVEGRSCLDLGTMEGLIPALLAKRGAREVLAVDHSNHSVGKIDAVKHYHGVDFEFRSVGLMYHVHERLAPRGFDVVNCSGLLYHVFSPLSVLASARPLVKRGGIMIVSTNVTLESEPVMRFNVAGHMQREANTYWYPTARLLDYLLRYLRLQPIDCAFLPHARLGDDYAFDTPSGYVSVACRAVDEIDGDPWMLSARSSWEYLGLSDWKLAASQDESDIAYEASDGGGPIDISEQIERAPPVAYPAAEDDSHFLGLGANS
jgi:2-polyprenyl-3-methyl-5-hydroxy-6-metoxy-1,4-benzoquinol methylase